MFIADCKDILRSLYHYNRRLREIYLFLIFFFYQITADVVISRRQLIQYGRFSIKSTSSVASGSCDLTEFKRVVP